MPKRYGKDIADDTGNVNDKKKVAVAVDITRRMCESVDKKKQLEVSDEERNRKVLEGLSLAETGYSNAKNKAISNHSERLWKIYGEDEQAERKRQESAKQYRKELQITERIKGEFTDGVVKKYEKKEKK